MLCDPWITPEDMVGCDCNTAALETGRLEEFIDAASEVAYSASGSQFSGLCTGVWRPPCHGTLMSGLEHPVMISGEWHNLRGCGCGSPMLLPWDWPASVTVKLDGADFTAFRLDGRILWRSDGQAWPCCQDESLPSTAVNTWEITAQHGLIPPASGRMAVRALVTELVRACTGAECRLPPRTTSVVRQGVTLDIDAFSQSLLENLTGITEFDLFLWATNPKGLRRRGRFWSPDVPATLG